MGLFLTHAHAGPGLWNIPPQVGTGQEQLSVIQGGTPLSIYDLLCDIFWSHKQPDCPEEHRCDTEALS